MNTPPTPDELLDRALALGKLMDDLDDGKAEPVPLDQLDDNGSKLETILLFIWACFGFGVIAWIMI